MMTQGHEIDVAFLSGGRTGFGTFGGALKDLSATQVSAVAVQHAVDLAEKYPLTREEGDQYAYTSQRRASAAWEGGGFTEASGPQYLALEKELDLDRTRTNVHGGAIASGHPLGASGARISVHLLHALRLAKKRYRLGSARIGGGQGAAVIVEAY